MWLRKIYYLKKSLETLRYRQDELSEFQQRQFSSIIDACRELKFYQERWPQTRVEDIEDISSLPVISSDEFRSQGADMSTLLQAEGGLSRSTSGTSGDPSKVTFNSQAYDWISAIYARTLYLQDYRPRRKIAQYWRGDNSQQHSWIGRKLVPKQYIRPEENLKRQINLLERYDPDILKYFPNTLTALCKRIGKSDLDNLEIDKIYTYGENLTPSARHYIADKLDSPIYDQFSTTEFGVTAWECPEGGYHLAEDTVYTEILDNEGEKVSEGAGFLVLTGLVNTATPLLRYKTGDIVETADNSCSCETCFRRIKKIRGRKREVFLNADEKPVFPDQVIDIIAPEEDILFYRLVAHDEKYRLNYVLRNGSDETSLQKAAETLRSELSIEPLELAEKDSLSHEAGKMEVVKNKQNQDAIRKVF